MEAVGHTPGVYSPDFHTYNAVKNGKPEIPSIGVPDSAGTFHRYGLEWYPDKLVYTLDDKPVYTAQKPAGSSSSDDWPFTNQRFYLILNLALGGDWAGDQTSAAYPDGINSTQLPARFEISSIDYYPLLKS